MAFGNVIRVSEYERLYYDDERPFKKHHWEALCRYLEATNRKQKKKREYFRILHQGIQFTNFVGVIQAGNLTIEVLPKIDKQATTAANATVDDLENRDKDNAESKYRWHQVLLQMLRECRFLDISHVEQASLKLRNSSVLDIYLDLFLTKTEKLLHEGLHKKYRKEEGNQLALKGQLQFSKQVVLNLTHQERFYVRHSVYNVDNIFNQLLRKTLTILPRIINSSVLSDRAGKLLLDFPEVSNCIINEQVFDRLVYDRKTERYKEALRISKMILLNYSPDISGGNEDVIAILFDMNKLWEEWVYRRLKNEEISANIIVEPQQSSDFWRSNLMTSPKTIRPDIVITDRLTGERIILDTKWKLIDDLVPDDDDLKQMYVYNLFWQSKISVLLYPAFEKRNNLGSYFDYKNPGQDHSDCIIHTITVLDESGKISEKFGQDLIDDLREFSKKIFR